MARTNNLFSVFRILNIILRHPLNHNNYFKALGRFILWQVGSRLVPGDVIYHWIEDAKFIVSPGEHGLTMNIYCGLHEFEDMAYVLHVLEQDDVFIDVGANVGSYTILACGVKGASVVCFEPVPTTYSKLLDNIRLNDTQDHVKAYNIGIADQEVELYFTTDQGAANYLLTAYDKSTDNKVRVKVLPLDIILQNIMPTLMKVDVEGFETLVIKGASGKLQEPSLHSVILEMSGNGEKRGFNEDKLVERMQSFGFFPYAYDPFLRRLIPLDGKNYKANNTLFCRQTSINLIRNKVRKANSIQIFDKSI